MSKFVFDLQRFADADNTSNSDTLERLDRLSNLFEWLEKRFDERTFFSNKDSYDWLQIFKRVSSALKETTKILKEVAEYKKARDENPSKAELHLATIIQNCGLIESDIIAVTASVNNLRSDKDKWNKTSWFLTAAAAGIGLVANTVAGLDGIEYEEKADINKSYALLLKALGKDIIKGFITEGLADKLINFPKGQVLTSQLLSDIRKQTADNFTKPGSGPLDFIVALITGGLNAIFYHDECLKKYTEDGIPLDIAKHDAFIDAVGKFVHDTATNYTKGLDDKFFKVLQGFVSWLTKTEAYDPQKNYVQFICDRFKTLSPTKNTAGKIGDDEFLFMEISNSMFYSDDGNDHIVIAPVNDTIWAGRGDDTIFSDLFDAHPKPERNSIFGGSGNDILIFHDNYSTIYGGTGNDTILISETQNKIFGDDDDDVIFFFEGANSNTAAGGQGNDIIALHGNAENIVIHYGDGDGKDTIGGLDENDKLEINGEYSLFESGDNIIVNVGEGYILLVQAAGQEVNINGSADKDIELDSDIEIPLTAVSLPSFEDFCQGADSFSIAGGTEGNDDLRNGNDISIGGKNIVTDTKNNLAMQGLGGKDTLVNYYGSKISMDGGTGDDYLTNIFGRDVIMNGGADNDEFINNGNSVTVNGDNGNDVITSVPLDSLASVNKYVEIYGGDGDDNILSAGEETTIYGGSGNDKISNLNGTSGNVKIFGETGNDNITNKGNNTTVYGGEGDDHIGNTSGSNVLIRGGKGTDSITNVRGSNVVMLGGDDNDTVGNGGSFATIMGGNGSDMLITAPLNGTVNNHVKIYGGNDDDTIISDSEKVTVTAGAGNDRIILGENAKNNLIKYTSGDGNDTVESFGTTDTLSIAGGTYSTQISGNDVLVNVGTGLIRLVNAKNLEPNIIGTYKTEPPPADTTPADTTPASTMLTVTNTDKSPVTINSAIEVVDASTRTKSVKITGNALDNTLTGGKGNDTLDGNSGDDLLTGGKGNDVFVYGAGSDTVTDYGTGNDKLSLTAAAKSFGYVGNDFVFDFDNGSLTLSDAASKKISVVGSVTKIFTTEGIYNAAGTAVTLSALTESFTADSKLVTIDAGMTSSATINGNSKANKVSLGNGENVFVWTGGNDTLDNFAADDLIGVTGAVSDASTSGGNSVIKVGTNKITVKDSSQVTFTDTNGTRIFDGGIFFDADETSATLAASTKNFDASDTDVTSITGNANANKLISNATGMTLTGGKGNDTFITSGGDDLITDYGNGFDKVSLNSSIESFTVTGNDVSLDLVNGSVTIANGAGKKISLVSGGKTNANIFTEDGISNAANNSVTLNASTTEFTANSKLVTIDASSTSNATVTGNAKANKVSLGNGENVYVWTGGNDTLDNFAADDLLSITGAVTDGSISGGNSVVKIGSNRITVKDSSQVTFTDTTGTRIFDGGIFFDENESSATLGSSIKDFAAADTDVVSITGNTKANKLHAGDSSTILNGGKGNDSLWGGSGSDTFIYAANTGTDKIFSFGEDDMLQILNANGSTGSFTKSTFTNTGLTLNVTGGGKIILDGVTSASTFNINGETYHVDGKSIVK